jgi:hypothetical protein
MADGCDANEPVATVNRVAESVQRPIAILAHACRFDHQSSSIFHIPQLLAGAMDGGLEVVEKSGDIRTVGDASING